MTVPNVASEDCLPVAMDFAAMAGIPHVSRIGISTGGIGGSIRGGNDEAEALAAIRCALDKGINLIETAPVYGFGRAEEIVGEALALPDLRSRAIIVTKTGVEWQGRRVSRNSSRGRILRDVGDSLRRLRTDYIDMYLVDWPDPLVPVEETAAVMGGLFAQGKIRAIGVSHFSSEQMDQFRKIAPIHVVEAPYNLLERDIERHILPYCRRNGIPMLGYEALCRGLLAGKMRPDTKFGRGDLRHIDPKFQQPRFAQYLGAVQRLNQLSQKRYDRRVIHLAVRWILDQGITAALWGIRRSRQLQAVQGVLGWTLEHAGKVEIKRVLHQYITQAIGPEFMAPPLWT